MIIQFIQAGDPEVEERLSALTEDFRSVIDRSVETLSVPEGTTSIGENAFASCSGLTEVTIPSSVTNIEAGAFAENRGLETINFEGTTPPTVEDGAFSQLPSGVTVTVPEGSEDAYSAVTDNIEDSIVKIILFTDYSGNTTEMYSKYSAITYDDASNPLPQCPTDGWARIETKGLNGLRDNALLFSPADEYMFDEKLNYSECTPLRGNAVDGVRSVPQKVTFKCPTLSQYFDGRIAEACSGLSSITFYCAEAPLLNTEATHITTADTAPVGELIVPEGSHNYGIYRERICGEDWTIKNLSGQTMGIVKLTDTNDDVQDYVYRNMPQYAFRGNTNIVTAFISGTTTISASAFFGCSNLTSITIDEGTSSIDTQAFQGCTNLASVTLPSTLTRLGNQTFFNCSALSSITCYATTAPSIPNQYTLYGVASAGTLYVPNGSDYSTWMAKLPSGWTIEIIPEPVHNLEIDIDDGQGGEVTVNYTIEGDIPAGMFSGRSDIHFVYLTEVGGIGEIGDGAFSGCTNLTGFGGNQSPDLLQIGNDAFRGCSMMESIDLPVSLVSIGSNAFAGCSNLNSIECYAEFAPLITDSVFDGVAEEGELHLYDSSVSGYENWTGALPSGWTVEYDNDFGD